MNKIKIKLPSIEDIIDFVNICDKYISDINASEGCFVIDAKSFIGMLDFANDKIIEVQMISPDIEEIKRFTNEIKKYILD